MLAIYWSPKRDIEPERIDTPAEDLARWPRMERYRYTRIGTACVSSGWIGVEYRADFGIYGIRGDDLFVRYEGGHRHGLEHGTGWRDEPYIWVSAYAFSTIEIFVSWTE